MCKKKAAWVEVWQIKQVATIMVSVIGWGTTQ